MAVSKEQIILQVEGMSCTGCETRIESALEKLEGLISVRAIFKSSEVHVSFDLGILDINTIVDSIEKLDYKVTNTRSESAVDGKKSNEDDADGDGKKKPDLVQFLAIGIILLALYLIINNTVGFNFIPQVNQSMGYGLLFVVGLLTSLHCVAMCGGINLSVCMQYKSDDSTSKLANLKPSILYNLGRVTSYTIIGGIVGALGSVISFTGTMKGIVSVLSGIFMVIMGLNMLNIFPWLRKFNFGMPKFFGKKIHSNAGSKGPIIVGLLNGLMPCGPLQAMQIYALGTGNILAGALSMFIFSMGTVPLMFGFGAAGSLIGGKFSHKMMKVSSVLVMFLGIIMLNRGLNLSGLGFVSGSAQSGNSSVARIENGVQVVSIELEPGGYSPIIVQKGIPVKWTINVEQGDLNGCNNPITIPQLSKQARLEVGENIIEFTPDEEGELIYTCWMGMISSKIKVVEDISSVTAEDAEDISSSSDSNINFSVPTDEIAVGEIKDGKQFVNININDDEYSPAVIVLQENIETEWIINGVQLNDHNNQMFFPEFNARMEVLQGENKLTLIPEFDFIFFCSNGTMNGYVKIVADINNINVNDILEEVKNYQPVTGGGASCH